MEFQFSLQYDTGHAKIQQMCFSGTKGRKEYIGVISTINRWIALLILSTLLVVSAQGSSLAEDKARVPDDATARTLDGKSVSLADYRGKLVFLIVWKTDCKACLLEIPFLNRLQREHDDEGFSVIGLSMDRNKDAFVQKVIEVRGIGYPVWLGYGQPISAYFRTDMFPTLFVVGPEGEVLGYMVGAFPAYDYALAVLKEARGLVERQKKTRDPVEEQKE